MSAASVGGQAARPRGRSDQAFMSATLARATAIFARAKKAQKITEYRDTAPLNGGFLEKRCPVAMATIGKHSLLIFVKFYTLLLSTAKPLPPLKKSISSKRLEESRTFQCAVLRQMGMDLFTYLNISLPCDSWLLLCSRHFHPSSHNCFSLVKEKVGSVKPLFPLVGPNRHLFRLGPRTILKC